jgi:hypothetical protein
MNQVERWIYFDGPEPASVSWLLDPLRDVPEETPEESDRVARALFARLGIAADTWAEDGPRATNDVNDAGPAALSVRPPPATVAPRRVRVVPAPAALVATMPSAQMPGPGDCIAELLTLEQYASLTVELGEWPERRAEILSRYRVDPAAFEPLRSAWQRRLAEDAGLRDRFERGCAEYTRWLRSVRW